MAAPTDYPTENRDLFKLWAMLNYIAGLPSLSASAMTQAQFVASFSDQAAATPLGITRTASRLQSSSNISAADLLETIADELLDPDGVDAGTQLRSIYRNTRDWDNSGLTLAQMTLAIYGRFTGTCTGQSGAAVPYSGNEATLVAANTKITDKINERKANQAIVFVVGSGVSEKLDGTYDWYCNIIG